VRFEPTPCRRRTAPALGLPRENHAWISPPEALGNETFSALSTTGGAPIVAREGPATSPHADEIRPTAAITANVPVRHEIGRVPEGEVVTAMSERIRKVVSVGYPDSNQCVPSGSPDAKPRACRSALAKNRPAAGGRRLPMRRSARGRSSCVDRAPERSSRRR
jgi:hypothetical protein